jgi:microcystin-dependent protein
LKYSVPNAPTVTYLDQAEPDDFDYQALGNRRTGILSGGDVSAQSTPGPSVQVAAGIALIKDIPVRFNAGVVAVANGGGNARFDIIAVSNQGTLINVAGAASANALYSTFDFDTYCPLGSVYVPPGSTSVLGAHVAPKGAAVPGSFNRTYDSAGATFLHTDASTGATFDVTAEGDHSWGVSKLRRVTNYAMDWATSLMLKAADEALAVLILRGRATNAAAQKVLQVQGSAGNELAYINGEGQLYADNLKFGAGNPNGSVVGRKGDIYISRSAGGSSLGIWQKGGNDGDTSEWKSYRLYDPSESAMPVGAIIASLSNTTPTGFIFPMGQWIDTTGATAALAAEIGARYGSQSGQVKMPDLRGLTLACGGDGMSFFATLGAKTLGLSVSNLPPHDHGVNDPGHAHPQGGPYAYVLPWQFHNNRHPVPSDGKYEHIYTEASTFDKNAATGITVAPTGNGEPILMFQPTHTVNLYVKL